MLSSFQVSLLSTKLKHLCGFQVYRIASTRKCGVLFCLYPIQSVAAGFTRASVNTVNTRCFSFHRIVNISHNYQYFYKIVLLICLKHQGWEDTDTVFVFWSMKWCMVSAIELRSLQVNLREIGSICKIVHYSTCYWIMTTVLTMTKLPLWREALMSRQNLPTLSGIDDQLETPRPDGDD